MTQAKITLAIVIMFTLGLTIGTLIGERLNPPQVVLDTNTQQQINNIDTNLNTLLKMLR
jgi:hypothetical protein